MAEGREQYFGSIFGPYPREVQSSRGVGLEVPERDANNADANWYQRDLDDLESNDPDFIDPLPTERHRRVP